VSARPERVDAAPGPALASHPARPSEDSRPRLVFFYSPASGRSRRAEGFLAQVLQRRRNHDTFRLVRVSAAERPELVERFRVRELPTICVVEDLRVVARVETPAGCRELEAALRPWLR
jgi:thioredoxin-like negative regulator of GroEL